MSRYTAIADASDYLIKLLRQFCVPDPIQSADKIGLVTDNTGNLSLGLRLYDIQTMNVNRFKPNCVPLCLRYKLTAHSNAIAEYRALEEHRILGKAISILAENPVIFAGTEFLSSDDIGISIVFENIDMEEHRRINAKDGDYTFVLYSVSPVIIDLAGKAPAERVRSTS